MQHSNQEALYEPNVSISMLKGQASSSSLLLHKNSHRSQSKTSMLSGSNSAGAATFDG